MTNMQKTESLMCPKCKKRMNTKRKHLWYPDQPDARVKCDKCGEWTTMRELGVTGKETS